MNRDPCEPDGVTPVVGAGINSRLYGSGWIIQGVGVVTCGPRQIRVVCGHPNSLDPTMHENGR